MTRAPDPIVSQNRREAKQIARAVPGPYFDDIVAVLDGVTTAQRR
ncbi:MAG: hypothetical protein QOE61_2599 [Micromonosporaceae bacterium]|jgi:hypothetical protein|nr:hypothetical protein [Micromonosporaceae bacterium]